MILNFTKTAICCLILALIVGSGCGKRESAPQAGEKLFSAAVETDQASGRQVIVLARGGEHPLEARIAPFAGANLFSLVYKGHELLEGPASLAEFDGSRLGVPVLYPTPCRMADGRFSFEGRQYEFGTNRGDTWIHGLVRDRQWQFDEPEAGANASSARLWIDFEPGRERYEKFPIKHRLSLVYTLAGDGLTIAYEVENLDTLDIPFGFGLHPYFTFAESPRRENYVCVPAAAVMELESLVPTGRLEPLDGTVYDLRQPRSFADFELDAVWTGMQPENPAWIELRGSGIKLSLPASKEFTHLIIWAIHENNFACVENMTCSPDVQNLYAKGYAEESHLLIVPPGGKQGGWVRYEPTDL